MTLNSEPTRRALERDQFSAPSDDETKALRRLYRKGPITIEVENTIDDCIQSGAVWRRHKRRNQKRLWENLGRIHRLWVNLTEHKEDQQAVFKACDREKIRLTAKTDVLLALIRLSLRPGGEAAHRYASALREAALQGISPEKLASHFAEKGHGINAMADAYRERKKAADAPDSKSNKQAKSGNGADEKTSKADPWDNDDGDGSEYDGSEGEGLEDEQNDAAQASLNFEFGGPNIRKKWRDAAVGTSVQVRIRKLAEDRGRILPFKRP